MKVYALTWKVDYASDGLAFILQINLIGLLLEIYALIRSSVELYSLKCGLTEEYCPCLEYLKMV